MIALTRITSHKPPMLTKRYYLNSDGVPERSTVASMVEGVAEVVQLADMRELAALLSGLKHDQALCFGVPDQSPVTVVTKRSYEERGHPAGCVPRTKDAFSWPDGAGVMLLDYDPRPGHPALSREQLREQLHSAAPALRTAAAVEWFSSSSMIYNGETGAQMNGVKGQRIWVGVRDAADIPRAGNALVERLWLAGNGWYEVSRSGALLERCTIDASVWQTNRLDFAAGAHCEPPLEQRRGDPVVTDGELLDTREAIPDLSEEERARLTTIKTQAKAEVKGQAEAAKQRFIEEMAQEIAAKSSAKDADQMALGIVRRAVENSVLMGDYPIILDDGSAVTVGDVLDDPGRYHGRQTRDPLEPEYGNNKVVGKLYLIGSRPNLYSFAHGGQNFRLLRQPRRIELVRGRTTEAVNQTITVMRELPDVFDLGGQLVTVNDGRAHAMDEHLTAHWLGGVVQYWHGKGTPGGHVVEVDDDPPQKVVKAVLSHGAARRLKALDAVITAPVITPDGTLVNTPGYHADSRLVLDVAEPLPPIPDIVGLEAVRKAVGVLMHPFKDFPFCTPLDKAIYLAALMTAVQRPVLTTAPGFALDAPVQGSGKTLLAQCAAALSTGRKPTVWPHTAGRDDEEVRKRIFTALRTGERVLIWDNVTGVFDSAAVATLLTGESYTDRQLGKSEAYTIPNRALFLMTGNNLTLAGDLPRRVLKCRIDPSTERPYARRFELDPLQYTLQNRQAMVAAALTIGRGWLQSDDHRNGVTAPGSMASFERWDSMVRQPIAWLNRVVLPEGFGDVMEAVDMTQSNDPEREALGELLRALLGRFGGRPFKAADVMQAMREESGPYGPPDGGLSDVVCDVVGREVRSARALGRVFLNRKGRIVDGLSLVGVEDRHTKSKRWAVKVMQEDQKEAAEMF